MRTAKAPILLIPLCLLVSCEFFEVSSKHFDNFEDAKIKGAVEAGWVPSWTPDDAYSIKETHNIETNEKWVVFSVTSEFEIGNICRTIDYNDFPTLEVPSWVPEYVFEEGRVTYQCFTDRLWYARISDTGLLVVAWSLG